MMQELDSSEKQVDDKRDSLLELLGQVRLMLTNNPLENINCQTYGEEQGHEGLTQ